MQFAERHHVLRGAARFKMFWFYGKIVKLCMVGGGRTLMLMLMLIFFFCY